VAHIPRTDEEPVASYSANADSYEEMADSILGDPAIADWLRRSTLDLRAGFNLPFCEHLHMLAIHTAYAMQLAKWLHQCEGNPPVTFFPLDTGSVS
jgi:hypothetical protein